MVHKGRGGRGQKFPKNCPHGLQKIVFKNHQIQIELIGGFPIKVESQISLLITYSLAI